MISHTKFKQRISGILQSFHPVNGTLEITSRCNAACGYCYISQEPKNKEFTLEQLKKIVDKLFDAGVLFLCITGGEPFIRSDIIPFLKYCIQKDFFKISMLTNGMLMTDEHLDLIRRHADRFSFVKISGFSHRADIHDAYTGVAGSLRRALDNAHKVRRCGVEVIISLNLLDLNCDDFEISKRVFERMGFTVAIGISKLISTPHLKELLDSGTRREFFSRFLKTRRQS